MADVRSAPRVSVVIPMYDIAPYVSRCLGSVLGQTYGDLEVIVVDDCSEDGTPDEIARYADDPRVRVVRHGENLGLHRARMTGVAEATGEWITFVDGDDELSRGDLIEALVDEVTARPVDILRYGMEAVAVGKVSQADADSMARWANAPLPRVKAAHAAEMAFLSENRWAVPWHATHRLMRADVVRRAFSVMETARIEGAEDAYEYLVLTSLADEEAERCDVMGYRYYMGGGVTDGGYLPEATFRRRVDALRVSWEAAMRYAEGTGDEALVACARGLRGKLCESAANMWHERLSTSTRKANFGFLVGELGRTEAATEMWRFVRDRAYDFFAHASYPDPGDELEYLVSTATSLEPGDGASAYARLLHDRMRERAMAHLADIDRLYNERKNAMRNQDIRIFVTTHKRVDVPDSEILQPVLVGPANRSDRGAAPFHDDEGDNISELNPMYCEMTTQYWAWKNVECDYVGFAHYRRYFNFTNMRYEENAWGEVIDDYIDGEACRLYGLDDATIRRCVEGYDVITTGFHDLEDFPGRLPTPRDQYRNAPYLHIKDLEIMAGIVKELHPSYAKDVDDFLDGHSSCFCNMYIMRKKIFDSYAAWVFPLLEEFMRRVDMSLYSKEALRTPGHLTERLFNIWYMHQRRTSGFGWKVKELQCVHFEKPDATVPLAPITEDHEDIDPASIVPVVLASDDNYVPMLSTTIVSMMENSSPDRFYDVVVFEKDITPEHQAQMHAMLAKHKNMSLRFHNVAKLVSGYDLTTNNAHISLETYYRFLIQEALPGYDKVLYLDSDLVVLGDVAELFDVEMGDDLIAAAPDVDFLGWLNNGTERLDYARDTLHMLDPYGYFQAGVLVLNTKELRKLHSVEDWLRIATTVNYIYDDQDILNSECQGRVTRIPQRWNVMHDCAGRVAKVFSFAPCDRYDEYMAARKAPGIIHYAGFEKPWVNPDCDYSSTYWEYARMTPFYESLIQRMIESTAGTQRQLPFGIPGFFGEHEKAVRENSPIRRVIDPIAPYGTLRREALKVVARKIQGKR